MSKIREYAAVCCFTIAVLMAYSSATTIMQGNLKQGLTPWWIDFAISNPMLFAIILVGGTALIGAPFKAIFG